MDRKNNSSRRIKVACIIVMVQMDRCIEYEQDVMMYKIDSD